MIEINIGALVVLLGIPTAATGGKGDDDNE